MFILMVTEGREAFKWLNPEKRREERSTAEEAEKWAESLFKY